MKGEFTAIIEAAPEGGYWAICPEVPGANGQGEAIGEAEQSLREAIRLIFEDRIEDVKPGLPKEREPTLSRCWLKRTGAAWVERAGIHSTASAWTCFNRCPSLFLWSR